MKMVEEYDKAVSYINRSAEIEEILQQKSQLMVRYDNLADLYLEMGEPDKAYEYCRKIESVASEIGSHPFISEYNFLMGKYYFFKNDLDKAGEYLIVATEKVFSNNHKPLLANIYLWRAKVDLKAGNTNSAIIQAQKAYNISLEIIDFVVDQQVQPAEIDIFLSPDATVDPPGGTMQDFSDPFIYTVTSGNGQTEKGWVVTVDMTTAVEEHGGGVLESYNNRTIEQLNNGALTLNISNLSAGIYFVRITIDIQTIVKKIIKL